MKKSTGLLVIFMLLGCGEHSFEEILEDVFGTGLEESNLAVIPQDISRDLRDADASVPKSVDLEHLFPPVQSQGQYGTCVAWSTGYAFKTALNAIDKNWSASDLAKPSNQTSPKDLWINIPNNIRSQDCNGTSFEKAMDALIANGAASMADVPYNMESSCNESSSKAKGDPNNKLANYRKIANNPDLSGVGKKEGMDLDNFKSYLAQGRPIPFAAKLGDRFRKWKDNTTLSSDYNLSGGHAMVLVGYDDSKSAFRVRNSWGTNWGDKGSIWVDYDFFLTNFCKYALIAQNPNSPPNPNPTSGDYDLLTSFAEDYPDPEDETGDPRKRAFSYRVYNNGTKDILASQRWGVYYLYYDAYDAEKYEIIFEDYYTDEYKKTPCTNPKDFENEVCWGKRDNTEALAGGIWNYMNIKPGKMAGEAEAGEGYVFEMPYYMPPITGDYYLVAYADHKDVIKESNEDNNLYFITAENGKPLKFKDGVMQSKPANQVASTVLSKRAKPAPVHSVVDLGELNAYTPQEIKTLLSRDKKNGVLAKKIAKYRENSAAPVKRKRQIMGGTL